MQSQRFGVKYWIKLWNNYWMNVMSFTGFIFTLVVHRRIGLMLTLLFFEITLHYKIY